MDKPPRRFGLYQRQKLTLALATKTRLPAKGEGDVNAFAPPADGAEMRPKVVPLMFRFGLLKCGVFVAAIASSRNSAVMPSVTLNRLRIFKSRSKMPGPLQFVRLFMLPSVPCAEFAKSIFPS